MGGPVTNKPAPVLSQAVKAKSKPVECRWNEHLAERKDGTKVCLEDFGAGESTSVRVQGYFLEPERVSTINLEEPTPRKTEKPTPPAPHDQFQLSPEASLPETIKGNETICSVATVRREVCNTLRPDDCFQDRQEEELCATGQTAKQELAKLCAGYYKGMGLAVRHHRDCWSYAWLSFSGPEQKK